MNHCYWFSSIQRNWGEAKKYCETEEGHLASITNPKIHDYIRSKVKSKHHETWFWVGGTDQGNENNWRWTDGSTWVFTKWATKQPDNRWWWTWKGWKGEHCLQIWKEGWNDQNCDSKIRFVCSRKICLRRDHGNQTIDSENNSSRPTDTIKQETNTSNVSNSRSDLPIIEVAIPSGVFLIVSVLVVICCLIRKRPKKKQETMNADLNPVYGVYELTETYERLYSTNEAVDNNHYYGK